MRILGIIDSKPSTAAVVEDGRVVAAVSEERLCRMKMASGFPSGAVQTVLELAGLEPREVDAVAVAQRVSVFHPDPVPWTSWFEEEGHQSRTLSFDRVGSTLAPLLGRFPLSWKAHHALKGWVFRERRRELPRVLRERHGLQAPVSFHDHHYCHATSAWYTSGMERGLVVTLDGGGDGLSGSVYLGGPDGLRRLHTVASFNSLGNFYSYVTELCGFRAERHEGKVTGLAALGEPVHAPVLRQFLRYQDPGDIRYTIPMYHRSALRLLRERLPGDFDRADLAASAQLVLEEIAQAFVAHWLRRTGTSNLALAGGVFANVKLNQRLRALTGVERIWIHPAMDDSGLSVGAALARVEQGGKGRGGPQDGGRMPHVYLGPCIRDEDVEKELRDGGHPARREADIHGAVAELLARGHVVARCVGRMEYGPRALGHRSILYRTDDPSVNDWLNQRLRRTEFMPFGPATLEGHAAECYHGYAGAEDPARFMTITFDCSREMRDRSPGVVHVDGTARPQVVDQETAPDFFAILSAYHARTGSPSLINTSFNIHEEPIVCSATDAFRAFREGNLDYLAINDWLVPHPSLGSQGIGLPGATEAGRSGNSTEAMRGAGVDGASGGHV
jgi:carbamoyltransferase